MAEEVVVDKRCLLCNNKLGYLWYDRCQGPAMRCVDYLWVGCWWCKMPYFTNSWCSWQDIDITLPDFLIDLKRIGIDKFTKGFDF